MYANIKYHGTVINLDWTSGPSTCPRMSRATTRSVGNCMIELYREVSKTGRVSTANIMDVSQPDWIR